MQPATSGGVCGVRRSLNPNPMKIEQIIAALVEGQLTAPQAIAALRKLGMSDEQARYIVNSMETIDVR